jgi:ribosomal protein L11 methyltransferase
METADAGRIMLRTYLPVDSRQRLAHIDVGVKLVSAVEPLGQLQVREVVDEDWQNSWKSHFDLLKVGHRLVIKPTWIDYEASAGEMVIEIDPGMAFGTGYHPTTYTCLEAIEELTAVQSSVLDLGTGSGILAIATVRLGAEHVVAMDIDSQAIKAARQNLRRTRTSKQVTLVQGSLPHATAPAGKFDMAVANISARAICDRAPFIVPTLRPGGVLVASGMMREQSPQVIDSLTELGCSLSQEWSKEEWVTLAFQLPSN